MINYLGPNQIFVFGSNLAGIHAGGAAHQAREDFGAQDGIGEGLTGRSYAFPTLDAQMNQLSHDALNDAVGRLYQCAAEHSRLEFLLTKVGCGIAGYDETYMASLFVNAPSNITKPDGWQSGKNMGSI